MRKVIVWTLSFIFLGGIFLGHASLNIVLACADGGAPFACGCAHAKSCSQCNAWRNGVCTGHIIVTCGCDSYFWCCPAGGSSICGYNQYACNSGCCNVGPSCPAAGSCPTGCGYGGGSVADGNCGTTSCGATGPCCSAVNGGWSDYGTCQASCTQTRTCTNPSPSCGGAGCSGDATQACTGGACVATLKGTFFDASDMPESGGCPADIGTNAAYAALRFGGADFNVTSTAPVDSQAATTNADGNYTATVAPNVLPKTYAFDYTSFLASGRVDSVKLECQSAVSTVTTGETVVKDTGFWRQYGGWWQVVGGSVYGAGGVQSIIPSSFTGTPNLILPDANGRYGILVYGTKNPLQLGTNTKAQVSTKLWEALSLYGGLRYDYNYYNTRMDVFASTAWDGGDLNYDDKGVGYQIFKHTGDVTLSATTLSGTQKVILLVDGTVTVNGDLIVPKGAFLGIIAKKNMIFNSAVAKAQGWFVAEGISVPCKQTAGECDKDDIKFLGEGSFVGWTNITLGRDQGRTNNQSASEMFTYRPDLLVNTPTPMKVYTRKFTPFVP